MPLAAILLVYFLLVLLLASLSAYPLYLIIGHAGFADVPFYRVVRQSMKLCALIGLVPLTAYLGLLSRAYWGFPRGSRFGRPFLRGLAFGIGTMAILVSTLLLLDVRAVNSGFAWHAPDLLEIVVSALLAGFVIGLVEECVFRGALYSIFRTRTSVFNAITVTALIYAALHFVRARFRIPHEEVDWTSGFVVVSRAFEQFGNTTFVDSFIALFAAGVLLGLIRHNTGGIAQCVGVHAGWVVMIKVTRKLTHLTPEPKWPGLVGDYDGTIGYLCFFWFVVLSAGFGYWRFGRGRER
jgi:membrane protease YdiL (CAAX protease family)